MRGKFIVFEGIKGSGKKTHIKFVAEKLSKLGKEVVSIGFPNFETDIAKLTKRMELDPYTLSLLYAADRSLYQERIRALLERGATVLSDRYCYSNFAYQFARNVPLDWLIEIEKNIIKPDLVILIDVPVNTSADRILQLNIEDFTKQEMLKRIQDEKDILEKTRRVYLNLAKDDSESRWYVVDGSQELEKNHEQIWGIIKKELKVEE